MFIKIFRVKEIEKKEANRIVGKVDRPIVRRKVKRVKKVLGEIPKSKPVNSQPVTYPPNPVIHEEVDNQ